MSESPTNIHGRKGGRGIRPWLLIPKVLSVAVYFGALVTMLAMGLAGPEPRHEIMLAILERVALPAVTAAVFFGVALWVMHFKALWRTRWLRFKLIALLVGLPILHLWIRSLLISIVEFPDIGREHAISVVMRVGLLIVWVVGIIWLGRHKPRLGQKVKPARQPHPT